MNIEFETLIPGQYVTDELEDTGASPSVHAAILEKFTLPVELLASLTATILAVVKTGAVTLILDQQKNRVVVQG
jgi:hypothetical protein